MPRVNWWAVALVVVLGIMAMNSYQSRRYRGYGVSEEMRTANTSGGLAGYDAMAPMADMESAEMYGKATAGAPMSQAVNAQLASSGGGQGGGGSIQQMQQSTPDRYLIRNGSLTLETKDPTIARDAIVKMAQRLKGYTGEERESVDSLNRKSISLTLRVPADDFEQVVIDLAKLGRVLDKWLTTEDVTEEYVDTESRIRNWRNTEARLIDHLANSKKLSDTLEVEKEITRIRELIEGSEGRLRFLAHRIGFSTLTIQLQQEAGPEPVTPAQMFSSRRELTAALRELIVFGQGIWAQVIWLAVWSIVWLPLLLIARLIWGRITRPRRRKPVDEAIV